MPIQNIIFDLGGVIIPVYPEKTIKMITQLLAATIPAEEVERKAFPLIQAMESGKIDGDTFLKGLETAMDSHGQRTQIEQAWQAMLGKVPDQYFMLLKAVKNHYRTFLLSNTNPLHFEAYARESFQAGGVSSWDAYFDGLILSYKEGVMKPDHRVYQILLERYLLDPATSLFIDDNHENVEAARACGLQAYWLHQGLELSSLFEPDGLWKYTHTPY